MPRILYAFVVRTKQPLFGLVATIVLGCSSSTGVGYAEGRH
jgi:hypothetical protein